MSTRAIRELDKATLDDFLSFFDHDAFVDNPDWAGCYCMFYQFAGTGREWNEIRAHENRGAVSSLVSKGKMRGLLAYDNGKPVAWCNTAPRESYPALARILKTPLNEAELVGSIVCFVVAPAYRGKGIASALLRAACEKFRKHGLEFAEAYPRKDSESAADNFPGPLSMYLKAGFKPVQETAHYTVARKTLLETRGK